jgi:hypothetical protein
MLLAAICVGAAVPSRQSRRRRDFPIAGIFQTRRGTAARWTYPRMIERRQDWTQSAPASLIAGQPLGASARASSGHERRHLPYADHGPSRQSWRTTGAPSRSRAILESAVDVNPSDKGRLFAHPRSPSSRPKDCRWERARAAPFFAHRARRSITCFPGGAEKSSRTLPVPAGVREPHESTIMIDVPQRVSPVRPLHASAAHGSARSPA